MVAPIAIGVDNNKVVNTGCKIIDLSRLKTKIV